MPYSRDFKCHKYGFIPYMTASIAQLVECPFSEREVVGSNPAAAPYHRCKKNGTSSSLADARIKRGCARKIKTGKYLLKI